MKKKHLFFATLFFAVLAFGFVGCENPDSESGISIEKPDDDSTSDKPNDSDTDTDGSEQDGNTKPTTPEVPTLVATGGASDVEYSTITLWGRINTDTLWAFPNIKWGIECSTSKEEMQSHKGKKTLCTTDLVGENSDEYSVAFTELTGGKMLYYNAYLVINDMKYIYGEVDSVHLDVKLTLNRNNTSYGTVTGSGIYDHLAEVSITATPKTNYYFTSWSDGVADNPRTVVVNSDTTFTANFAKKPYLTVNTNNTSYGTVTGSGYYMPGDEVTITATPKENYYYFTSWSDGVADNPRTVVVNSDTTFTANFASASFSISSTKQVYFSPGNLQYHPANDDWRFAENQTDYIGSRNTNISATYNGWIDLFGWGTGADPTEASEDFNDYQNFVDWGKNRIEEDNPDTWRALTKSEWEYLLNSRTNSSALIGVAQVNGVNGLILLPDNWSFPLGITFKSGFHNSYSVYYYAAYQTFTVEEWSKMESAGAVFLPAAGVRYSSTVNDVRVTGNYWSADKYNSINAHYFGFNTSGKYLSSTNRYVGNSVRLVKDL